MRFAGITLGLCVVLSGCAVGPDFTSPPPPQTFLYTETPFPEKTMGTKGKGGEVQSFCVGQDIQADWWTLFQSKPLNTLVKKALQNNPTVQAAQAALRQAEADLRVSIAPLFPFVDAQFSPARERINFAAAGLPEAPALTFNLFNTSVNVSYTLDVFGGIRRQIEASAAQVDFQKFEVEATYLTLISNVITAAVTEASIRAQIKATEELIESEQNVLNISTKRFELGAISRLDIFAEETQLEQVKATLPILKNNLAKIRHGLAVLIGEFPSEACLPTFHLNDLDLPVKLPVSIPSMLVRQRPDIRASEALLHAASAQIGVATANLLPQFTLTGSLGASSNKISDLFDRQSLVWSIIGNVLQPIFHGGALIAQRDAAVEGFNQAAAQYRQTVLQAFQNVADSLRALEFDAQALHIQTKAEEAGKSTLFLTRDQYKLGGVSYLNLIDAQRRYHLAQIARIIAIANRYTDTVALFQALGGGWWNRVPSCTYSSLKEDTDAR